jgi:hypothetical protein
MCAIFAKILERERMMEAKDINIVKSLINLK